MGFRPLTLNTPPEEEAHILAEDDAAIFQSIFGKDGVFETGDRMKATVINNNQVRVSNGVICVGGHIGRTEYGDYSDMIIENGEISKNRNDIIMAVFSTTGKTGIDEFKIEVKKGTPGIAAEDPEIVKGNLYEGSKIREFPLWRVKLEGINIVGVEQMFNVIPTIPELEEKIELLNGKSIVESGSNDDGNYIKYADGTLFMWGTNKILFGFSSETTRFGEFYVSRVYTRNFPVESITACCVQAMPYNNSYSLLLLSTVSLNKKDFSVRLVKSGGADYESLICWQAIGRWK